MTTRASEPIVPTAVPAWRDALAAREKMSMLLLLCAAEGREKSLLRSAWKRTVLIAFDDFTARPPRGRAVTKYADQFGPPDSLSFASRWRSPPMWRIMIQPLGKRAYS